MALKLLAQNQSEAEPPRDGGEPRLLSWLALWPAAGPPASLRTLENFKHLQQNPWVDGLDVPIFELCLSFLGVVPGDPGHLY